MLHSTTFQEAIELAGWYTRYALDHAPDGHLHPGVMSHLTAASTQHTAVEELLKAKSA